MTLRSYGPLIYDFIFRMDCALSNSNNYQRWSCLCWLYLGQVQERDGSLETLWSYGPLIVDLSKLTIVCSENNPFFDITNWLQCLYGLFYQSNSEYISHYHFNLLSYSGLFLHKFTNKGGPGSVVDSALDCEYGGPGFEPRWLCPFHLQGTSRGKIKHFV